MSMLDRRFLQFLASVALSALCAASWAQSYGAFNKDTIYGTLRQDERESFDKTVNQALQDPQDGKVLNWHSANGRRNPPSAQIYIKGAREQNGMPCRDVHAGLQQGSAHENWNFWFCRRSDGQWRAASQTLQ